MEDASATIKRSDFELRAYSKSNNLIAAWQILSVLVPYVALWYAAYAVRDSMPWLLVPIVVVMSLFLLRSFSLMHDCGHFSLFRQVLLNRIFGFILGVLNGLPQYPWSRGHAYHHKYNGNWERYRGPAAVVSTEQFAAMSPVRQKLYALLRHPLMLFPGGFFYLIVKPRVQLLCGLVAYIPFMITCLFRGEWRRAVSLESKFWYTKGEFYDYLFNNIFVLGSWYLCGALMGHAFFWALYAPMVMLTAATFICIFYIQHNFEDSYAHRDEDWSYLKGALEGSSYLKMPAIFNFFTADIGYHNVHHISALIPNYRLAACHRAHAHLLTDVTVIRISDIPRCCGYILWDAARDRLITIAEFKQQQGEMQSATA